MGNMTKRCAVCTEPVRPAAIFCSTTCRDFGRTIRSAQPDMSEDFTLAFEVELPVDVEVSRSLHGASEHHRCTITLALAAYTEAEHELDAVIWAAHKRGWTDREIGHAVEMRTSNVRQRVLSFQARLHGPATRPSARAKTARAV